MAPPSGRIDGVDMLRGLAIFFVLMTNREVVEEFVNRVRLKSDFDVGDQSL